MTIKHTQHTYDGAYNLFSSFCLCNKKRKNQSEKKKRINVKRTGVQVGRKREDKRGKAKQLHMDIGNIRNAVFALCYTQPKNARLFFPLFFFLFYFFVLLDTGGFLLVFCVVSNDLTLVIIGWEGTHTKKNGKNSRGRFWGGVSKKKKRERLSNINYIGCERYITPAIYLELLKMPIVNLRVYSCVSLC